MSQSSLIHREIVTSYPDLLPDLGIMCQSLYVIFHEPPSFAQLAMLDRFTLFKNYFAVRQNDYAQQNLEVLADTYSEMDEHLLDALTADYQQLFIGPENLSAPPWGSVYLHPNKEIFDDSTVEVDNFYRLHGLLLDTGMNEPADHIGLMFAFMAWLFSRDLDERYNSPSPSEWQKVTQKFVSNYVLTWSEHFLMLMHQNAATPYYQKIAILAQTIITDIADYSGAVRKSAIIY